MQRIVQLLPPFNSAPTWGTQPVLNVPLRGRSCNFIDLRVIGTGPSSALLDVRSVISDIELLPNDKPVATFKPKLEAQFRSYGRVNAVTPAVDFIRIPFDVPGIPTPNSARRTWTRSRFAAPSPPNPRARPSRALTPGRATTRKTSRARRR